MFYHQSLDDAINQLKSMKISKKNSITEPANNRYLNKSVPFKYEKQNYKTNNTSQLIYLPSSSDNKTSQNNKSISSSNTNKAIEQDPPALISIYPTSTTNPKVIKPTSALITDNPNKKLITHIHPPDTSTINTHEANPRFSTPKISPPAPKPTQFTHDHFKRPPNRQHHTKSSNNQRVHFDNFLHKKLPSSKVNLYYKFGLRLLNETNAKKRASYYLKIAADNGHVGAMSRYASIQYDGYHVGNPRASQVLQTNRKEAAVYFKKAADLGDAKSMRRYRSMLIDGDGVEKDAKKAASMYKEEADKGVVGAISQYGTMLFLGEGVERDLNEAVRYFRLSVEKKDRFGVRMLAYSYLTGCGVECSVKEAVRYYKMAADWGDDESARQLLKIADSGCNEFFSGNEIEKYRKLAACNSGSAALKKYRPMSA